MPSLKELRGRIKSAKNIQQITKAMKMVAAARLRKSQDRMLAARPFALKIASVIGDVAGAGEQTHPLLVPRENAATGPLRLVVIAADKGLCGAFNVNIIRATIAALREAQAQGRPVALTVVGRKPRDFFKSNGIEMANTHVGAFQNLHYAFAEVLAKEVTELYSTGAASEVRLIFTNFISTMTLKVENQRLLPFSLEASEAFEGAKKESFGDYEFEPSRERILDSLVPRAVTMAVWRALLESQASEFAARMTAMDSATRNSKDMINNLTLKANRIRQAVITKEIAELVGGAEALK
jgi:F-type H+-transporting ATPase subunit gamma